MSTSNQWPLNLAQSHQTPGYYSDMAKPIFAWNLDDVLESVCHNPEIPADRDDIEHIKQQLDQLGPEPARRINRAIGKIVANASPQFAWPTVRLAEKVVTITGLLADGNIRLSPADTLHPEPDENRFPTPTLDDATICRHRPVYSFSLTDVYQPKYASNPTPSSAELVFLQNMDTEQRVAFDRVIDAIAEEYDDAIANVLAAINHQVWLEIKKELQRARISQTAAASG